MGISRQVAYSILFEVVHFALERCLYIVFSDQDGIQNRLMLILGLKCVNIALLPQSKHFSHSSSRNVCCRMECLVAGA